MSSDPTQPLVSIGLPVYHRPELLRHTLESLTQQSYRNLEIVVSDDCSPGTATRDVVEEFARADPRVRYIRQARNIGALLNHRFVFEQATGEYFFWASEDDEWSERYFETGIRALLDNPSCDAWCCTIRNTDAFGRVIREYPGFSRWTSTSHKWRDLVRFLREPEIMGKSHVTHSIFRYSALRKTVDEYFFTDGWGTDMSFATAFLCRYDLVATDEVLFDKRVVRASDRPDRPDPMVVDRPIRHIFPLIETVSYIREHYRATRTTPYQYLVVLVMLSRIPTAIRNEISLRILFRAPWKAARVIGRLARRALDPARSFRRRAWRKRFGYVPDVRLVDVRWATVETYGAIQVPIDNLRAPIHTSVGTRLMGIESTPHFRWIRSLVAKEDDALARGEYRDYLEAHYPDEDPDAGLDQVVALVSAFAVKRDQDTTISIVTHEPVRQDGRDLVVIFDGVHRAAIACALGRDRVECRLVSGGISRRDMAAML